MIQIRLATLMLSLLSVLLMMLGISQISNSNPSWLIQNMNEESLIQLALWVENGEYAIDESPSPFVSFQVHSPSYIYLFNVSPQLTSSPPDQDHDSIQLLLPNRLQPENFYPAGEYALDSPFAIVGPEGIAHLQLIASPVLLPFEPRQDLDFREFSLDPSHFFEGLEVILRDKELLTPEWSGTWINYAVKGGLTPAASGSRCAKLRIHVPEAEGQIVRYRIDSSCVTGSEMLGQFIGPTSKIISQVREGERQVSIAVEGMEEVTLSHRVQFGRTQTLEFPELSPADHIGFNIDPPNPSIWQEITFHAKITTDRDIATYIWDFGDGSAPMEGETVNYAYVQNNEPESPYRVRLNVLFDDDLEPSSETYLRTLEIKVDPDIVDCPEESISSQQFANSILLESDAEKGCIVLQIPEQMINSATSSIHGEASFHHVFSWERLPDEADLQAAYHILYEKDGSVVDKEPRIMLVPAQIGNFARQAIISVPSGSDVNARFVMHISKNPMEDQIALEIQPISIDMLSRCADAQLVTRNPASFSEGDYLTFNRENQVYIVFKNAGCGEMQIQEDSISVSRNGVQIAVIKHESIMIERGQEQSWIWNPSASQIGAPEKGLYTIQIRTSEGIYVTWICLI